MPRYHEYIVLFMNSDTRKVSMATFCSLNENSAVKDFRECYRHGGSCKVLSVTRIPDEED